MTVSPARPRATRGRRRYPGGRARHVGRGCPAADSWRVRAPARPGLPRRRPQTPGCLHRNGRLAMEAAARNLFVIGRPVRDRAIANIGRAETILAEVQQILAGAPPFDPASPHPNSWAARSAPQQGRVNPAFVDPHQHGALHTPEPGPTSLWRRPWVLGTACVAVLTLAALAAVALLIIG